MRNFLNTTIDFSYKSSTEYSEVPMNGARGEDCHTGLVSAQYSRYSPCLAEKNIDVMNCFDQISIYWYEMAQVVKVIPHGKEKKLHTQSMPWPRLTRSLIWFKLSTCYFCGSYHVMWVCVISRFNVICPLVGTNRCLTNGHIPSYAVMYDRGTTSGN